MAVGERWRRLGTAAVVFALIMKPSAGPVDATPAAVKTRSSPVPDHDDLVQQVAPYLVGALPILFPVLALGVFGDPAVLRTLLWRGNPAALSAALIPALLPLLAAGALFLVLHPRSAGKRYGRTAWPVLATGCVVALFVPITWAALQVILLVVVLLLVRPGRRWRTAVTVSAILIVSVLALDVVIAGHAWNYRATLEAIPRAVTGRIVYELPREVVVRTDAKINAYYVVDVDDTAMTTITGYPARVEQIADGAVVARAACQYRPRLNDRSVVGLLPRTTVSATPYCEDLLTCMEKRPLADTEDAERAALRQCLVRE